jgi:UDP-2,3-diacylglucosamine pyrophosphatase LpxH
MVNTHDTLSRIFAASPIILYDNSDRFVIMSDIHRGDGSWKDDFSKNQLLYYAALRHYYKEKFTYIELGDGDELWENKDFNHIMHTYSNIFLLMKQFYDKGRLYLIYGNHDQDKQDEAFIKKHLYSYFDRHKDAQMPLFQGIKVHEGLVLQHKKTQKKIFLTHGHQADYLNNQFWKLSRFLVRYLWGPFENVGIRNPMSTSNNDKKKTNVEQRLIQWAKKENQILIAGHTHRTAFPSPDAPQYYNDGCCVHLRYITAIEIENGAISLVKWSLKTKDNGIVFVDRDLLIGPQKL